MKRVIYSLYIDIPDDLLGDDLPYKGDNVSKNLRTKLQFKQYSEFLTSKHKEYADHIGADYFLFEYDEQYQSFERSFMAQYPEVNYYCIVNFYKIHMLYKLAEQYDEVLYLDLDAVPTTRENFFDLDLANNGIACKRNTRGESGNIFLARGSERETFYQREVGRRLFTDRAPEAKFWNCMAMLQFTGHDGMNDIFNTGVVGADKEHLKKLGYWDDFDDTYDLMTEVKNEEGMFPDHITRSFGYDNETIFSYKIKISEVKNFDLTDWHFIHSDETHFIDRNAKIVHMISKKFDLLEKYYEKINL